MREESTFNQGLGENLICRSLDACLRKRGMTGEKYIRKQRMTNKKSCQLGGMTLLFCLLSSVVHAECVPTPDCASIGYTATSCDGGFLRCPFDTSKLFCVPCDSSYKYTCSGENITGGVGSSCGGKYVGCTCFGGYEWNSGICERKQNCTVGMIYYSDKSCSFTYDSSKTAIGVVVKDNELVMSKMSAYMYWSTGYIDTSLTNDDSTTNIKKDFNGKLNTATIIAEDSSNVAAKYCNDFTTTGTNARDWYLPAAGELYSYVYGNYDAINTAMTTLGWEWEDYYLWSSSEYEPNYAWVVTTHSGVMRGGDKNGQGRVSCLLAI